MVGATKKRGKKREGQKDQKIVESATCQILKHGHNRNFHGLFFYYIVYIDRFVNDYLLGEIVLLKNGGSCACWFLCDLLGP